MEKNVLKQSIRTLEYILKNEKAEQKQLEIIIVLINLRNELGDEAYMERNMWLESINNLKLFLNILNTNKSSLDGKILNFLQGEEKKYTFHELVELFNSNVSLSRFIYLKIN